MLGNLIQIKQVAALKCQVFQNEIQAGSTHGRIISQISVSRKASLLIVDQGLNGNPCTSKTDRAMNDFSILT